MQSFLILVIFTLMFYDKGIGHNSIFSRSGMVFCELKWEANARVYCSGGLGPPLQCVAEFRYVSVDFQKQPVFLNLLSPPLVVSFELYGRVKAWKNIEFSNTVQQ